MRFGRSSIAHKIEDALRHRRFREGSLLAETVIPQTADARLLLLCSMAYFYADRFVESDELLKRVRRLDDTYPALNEFEAFVRLKSAATRDDAALAYLSLSDAVPGVRRYNRILSRIRSVHDFPAFQKKAALLDFVRPVPLPEKKKKHVIGRHRVYVPRPAWWFVPVLLLCAGIAAGVYRGISFIQARPAGSSAPAEPSYLDTVTLDNEKYPLIDRVTRDKKEYFFYDESQVRSLFETAKKNLKDGQFNQAVIAINTLSLSNANISVKERAEFLKKFIPGADRIPPMKIEPSELFRHGYLYEGAVVSFSGKAANVETTDGKMTFSLLVNFSEKTRFDGVVEVYSEKEISLSNGDHIEMSGLMINPSVGDGRPYMQAVTIKKL